MQSASLSTSFSSEAQPRVRNAGAQCDKVPRTKGGQSLMTGLWVNPVASLACAASRQPFECELAVSGPRDIKAWRVTEEGRLTPNFARRIFADFSAMRRAVLLAIKIAAASSRDRFKAAAIEPRTLKAVRGRWPEM